MRAQSNELTALRVCWFRGYCLGLLGLRVRSTWRFMGSYKWVTSPLIWVITIVARLITSLITTHEPPSSFGV